MVTQYPYQLVVKGSTGGGFVNGDPVPGTPTESMHAVCRDESNTGNKEITLPDGRYYVYNALIQLPFGTPEVAFGTEIEVRQGSVVRVKGTVKGFRSDQMHCRLWV